MDITDIREQIDMIDDALVKLFLQRMQLSAQIAAYKKSIIYLFMCQPERKKSSRRFQNRPVLISKRISARFIQHFLNSAVPTKTNYIEVDE